VADARRGIAIAASIDWARLTAAVIITVPVPIVDLSSFIVHRSSFIVGRL
jgi:hypothetical protein